MNTTGFRMYCSAHQKVSDDTDKGTVKDYLWLSTFIPFCDFFFVRCSGAEKAFWESITMGWCAFVFYLTSTLPLSDTGYLT